jgi:hypothetical protein
VIKELVRIQRNFLWGGGSESKKIVGLVGTQYVYPNDQGGLGIKNLEYFNHALLCKWKWRALCEKNSIWHELQTFRYGSMSITTLNATNRVNPIVTLYGGVIY